MIAGLCRRIPLLAATSLLLSCVAAPEELAEPVDEPESAAPAAPAEEPANAAPAVPEAELAHAAPEHETPPAAPAAPLAAPSCAQAMAQSMRLNGALLIRAAARCFREQRHLEGTFLLIAGQVRSMTDMSVLEPAGDADKRARAALYALIRTRAGGAGSDELYRDPGLTRDLFARLEGWHPAFFAGYDPGWRYDPAPNAVVYDATARGRATFRLAQLRRYAELIRDDDYYAASRELAELRKRNPRGFRVDSVDAQRAAELLRVMKRVDQTIPTPMPRMEGSGSYRLEPETEPILGRFGGPGSLG